MIFPLDTHAHIEPEIAPSELVALRSCVVAVTRTVSEFHKTQHRSDPGVVWGVGCHPGLAREVQGFSAPRMREAIVATPVIGEVGLDGAARTPMEAQLAAFREVLEIAADTPRVVSIHSYRATDLVLRELREIGDVAPILHWWLGTPAETETAVDVGAYFSINASQAKKWSSLHLIPKDRILLETDHPFGDRAEGEARRPGMVTRAETAISAVLGITAEALRLQTWRNLRSIAEQLGIVEMFPREFQVQFLAA